MVGQHYGSVAGVPGPLLEAMSRAERGARARFLVLAGPKL